MEEVRNGRPWHGLYGEGVPVPDRGMGVPDRSCRFLGIAKLPRLQNALALIHLSRP